MRTDSNSSSTRGEPIFYGWRIVAACFLIAVVTWSLTVFGASVYVHTIAQAKNLPISQVSFGVTLFYLAAALLALPVGHSISRSGPKATMIAGAIALALSVVGLSYSDEPWQIYLCFAAMGVAYAGLGTTALSTVLAPWFDRHQGRVISLTLMGASVGGMTGAPLLLLAITAFGFRIAAVVAAAIALAIICPIVLLVLRRSPTEMGLNADGERPVAGATDVKRNADEWQARAAIRTPEFVSVVVTFGLALAIQLAFLTHHIELIVGSLGETGAAGTVSATSAAALLGRMLFSHYADRITLRLATAMLLVIGSLMFLTLAVTSRPVLIVLASILYGTTLGNITALSPMIVRQEFGAPSFGTIYGAASMGIGLASASGPALWGFLHAVSGSFSMPLIISSVIDVVAAVIILGCPLLRRGR